MTIQRLYQPDPAASDRVAEILYRLLLEPAQDDGKSAKEELSGTKQSTCVSAEAEG
jgi:hypothetical protein